jgi:hypothetical protein
MGRVGMSSLRKRPEFFSAFINTMKKQQRRKSLKTQPSLTTIETPAENKAPGNSQAIISFVQAKPSFISLSADLTGTWKTCGENIVLTRSSEPDTFEGRWGVHLMKFKLEGDSIPAPYLGSIALMFDGTVCNANKITWGNGQVWTRL